MGRHISISCSVASNVPVFFFLKATCFVSKGDSQALVNKIICHLEKKIVDAAYKLLSVRFASINDQLRELDFNDLATRVDEYMKHLSVIVKIRLQHHKELFGNVLCR